MPRIGVALAHLVASPPKTRHPQFPTNSARHACLFNPRLCLSPALRQGKAKFGEELLEPLLPLDRPEAEAARSVGRVPQGLEQRAVPVEVQVQTGTNKNGDIIRLL